MRVVHLACAAPPQIGGLGQAPFVEVQELVRRGVEAVLLAPDYRSEENAPEIKRLPTRWAFGHAAALDQEELEREVATADIVHLHYPFYGTAGLAARLRRQNKIKRLVMTLHMDAQAPGVKGLFFDLHRKFFQDKILQSADALIVSSLDYAEHSSFASYVNRGKMHELPFGVDENKFLPGEKNRGKFGLPSDAKVVAFVGGLDKAHAFKGIPVLLKALVDLPDVHCLLVGDGDLKLGYEQMAKRLGLASRVKFLGRIPSQDLPDVYRAAHVFVLPSLSGAEAFGLVALEAQSCGLPVVASDLPGVRTVVADRETGYLVPVGDANALADRLSRILSDGELRQKMGESARQRVLDRFTWDKHMDGLMEVYRNVI